MAMAPTQLIFKKAPLPPSANNQYRSFVSGGKVRHVSSKELVAFKKEMNFFFLENKSLLNVAKTSFAGAPISFHVDFGFERSRLVSKKGTFKRLDVSNRLKALHDAFACALEIDDSMFVEVSARKFAVKRKEDEGADVVIEVCDFMEVVDSQVWPETKNH